MTRLPRPVLQLAVFGLVSALSSMAVASLSEHPSSPAAAATELVPVVLINAGGPALVDEQGRSWIADTGVGGRTSDFNVAGLASATPSVDHDHRHGDLDYAVAVPAAGDYRVRLHLTELYHHNTGQRLFDVDAEGVNRAKNVDILALVPWRTTYLMDLDVPVTDGTLNLAFRSVRDRASVSGIEVLRAVPIVAEPSQTTSPAPAPSVSTPSGVEPSPIVRPSASTVAPTPTPTPTPSPSASTTAEPSSPAPSVTAPSGARGTPIVPVEQYGAVGDGVTDDTKALQRALDAAGPGSTLLMAAGKTYVQSDVLHIRRDGTHLSGPGSLLATREDRSSLWVEADNVLLDGGLTLDIAKTTRRWEAWEQMRLRLLGHSGFVARDLRINGAAAAGVYVGNGAHDFLLERVEVRGTRADGIHMTGGAYAGRVLSPSITSSGDDGVAVVSYGQDGPPCHDITVTSPRVLGTVGGRGLSVVGGTDITYSDVYVFRSSSAAVYIGSEGNPYFTAPPVRVKVLGGTLSQANTDRSVDHGAVVVLSGGDQPAQDVLVQGLTIRDTRATASRSVGVITYRGAPRGVVLRDLDVIGGPSSAYEGNTSQSGFRMLSWTVDGKRQPDRG